MKFLIKPRILFLVFLTTFTLLWAFLPELIRWQVASRLADSGFELTLLSTPRLVEWQFRLEQMEIESDELKFSARGMSLNLFEEYRFQIKEVDLVFKKTTENGLVQREALIDSLRQIADQIVLDIRIDSFKVCHPGCTSFGLTLEKGGRNMQIRHQDGFILGVLSNDTLAAEVILSSPVLAYFSADLDFSDQHLVSFSLKGAAENRGSSTLGVTRGDIQYSGILENLKLDLEGSIPSSGPVSIERWVDEVELKVRAQGVADWQVSYHDIAIKGHLESDTLIELSLSHGLQEVSVQNGLSLTIEHPSLDSTSLAVSEPIHCVHGANLFCETENIVIRTSESGKGIRASLKQPELRLQNEDWVITSGLDASIFEVGFEAGGELTLMTFKTDHLEIDQQNLILKESIASILGVQDIEVDLNYDIQSSLGSVSLKIESQMEAFLSVADYFNFEGLQILHGEVLIDSVLHWRSSEITQFNMGLSMKELDASFQGYNLKGGELSSVLDGWPLIVSSKVSKFSAEVLDIGVVLKSTELNFSPAFNITDQSLKIKGENLSGSLFGGNVHSEGYFLSYEDESLNGQIDLEINRVSLSDVLALEREDIEGSGSLSGSVPVQIKDGKLSIENGVMAALDPGGIIKYEPAPTVVASIKDNSSLELIVNVMSDFRYDSLDIGLNYSPDGILIAKTSLKGSNPSFENGREIHFNLNLEENVLTLLRSIRLSNELAENLKLKGER